MDRVSLTLDGSPREYALFAPPAATRPVPLVVFLHGAGGSAEWADGETGWSALAARAGFALALPEGLLPHPDQPPKFLTNPRRWNDAAEVRGAESGARDEAPGASAAPPSSLIPPSAFPASHADDVAFLGAVVADAVRRAGADPRRVYLSGFSNGAGMTFRAAAGLADRLAAVAPVAGYCRVPAGETPARPVPTLYVVGTADPLIPLRGGDVRSPWTHRLVRRPPVADTLDRWAALIGCGPVPVTETDAGGVRVEAYPGPAEFRVMVVEGLGHHWPGGKGQLNPKIAGPPSGRLDATAEVWRFFQRHSL